MKIDYNNRNSIRKNVYVHDSTFDGFSYYEEKKIVSFNLKNKYLNKCFKIDFYNTIGISCQICNSLKHCIFDLDLCDEKVLTEELKKFNDEASSLLEKEDKYIETFFLMTSGDIIRIACEYIIFEEEPLKEDD